MALHDRALCAVAFKLPAATLLPLGLIWFLGLLFVVKELLIMFLLLKVVTKTFSVLLVFFCTNWFSGYKH